MTAQTGTDAYGRDRVIGPEEAAYSRWVRRTSWTLGVAIALALMFWLVSATNTGEPIPEAVPAAWLATAVAIATLPARMVVGALEDAARAARR